MNEIQIFNNEEFGQVRTVEIDGKLWFLGIDIAASLQYSDKNKAVSMHVDEEDKKTLFYKASDKSTEALWNKTNDFSDKVLINESGLYSMIMSSKLPSAKKFKHWITSDVLPSIRKHGIYATDNVINQILNNPDFGIELLTTLKKERAARIEAERKNAILTHVNKTYTMTEIAKELNMKSANELNKLLKEKGIQYKVNDTWVFYSKYSNLGYEEIKQDVLDSGKVIYHRKITQTGREFILDIIKGR